MQCAIRIDLSAAAPDKNLPADNFRRYRARVGTSSARKRPLPVKIPAILLRYRRRWFFGRHLPFYRTRKGMLIWHRWLPRRFHARRPLRQREPTRMQATRSTMRPCRTECERCLSRHVSSTIYIFDNMHLRQYVSSTICAGRPVSLPSAIQIATILDSDANEWRLFDASPPSTPPRTPAAPAPAGHRSAPARS